MIPIPVNPAEAIVSAFWDPNLSNFSGYQVKAAAGGGAKQTWASVDFNWPGGNSEPKIVFSRDFDLDCTGYDRLIAAVVLPAGTRLAMTAATEAGERKMTAVTPDDKGKTTEYLLPLDGAKKITRLTVAFSSPKSGGGFFKWIGLHSTAGYRVYEEYWNNLRRIDLTSFLNNIIDNPSCNPALELICGQRELELIRRRVAASPESLEKFRVWRDKLLGQLKPESRLREYATGDPRFVRDRDAGSGAIYDSSGPAWVGAVLKDPAMMRLAAKRAIILALCPKWGAGILSSLPGTTWEHRCFDESYAVLDLIVTLDLAGEFLSSTGKDLILRVVAERGLGTINFNAWKYGYIYDCNQLAAFSPGRIAAYTAMEKSKWPHVAPYTDLAMKELDYSMGKNFHADGGFLEGPSYYQYTLWGALPAYYIYARTRNKPFTEILPKELRMAPAYADLLVSTDESQYFIPINDCYGRHGISIDPVAFLAAMFPDSQYVRLYNRLVKQKSLPAGARWAWMVGTDIPKTDPPYRPFVIIPSISSAASVRELDGAPVKLALLGDAVGNTHKHDDAGAFIIEYAGETLAMDSDSCSYASPFQHVIRRGDRHNVMLPTGVPATGNGRVRTPLPFKASGDRRSFRAEINLQPCWSEYFAQLKRSVESSEPATITITDRWELKKGDGVAFNWLTPQEIKVNGREVTIAGKRGMAKFTVPEGWELRTETLEREGNTPQQRLTLTSRQRQGELKLDVRLALKR